MTDEHPVRRCAIALLDARNELFLDEAEEVGHTAARSESRLRLPVGIAVGMRRRHVARTVRIRDRDDDHLRQHERPVYTGAEDLNETGDGVEMRVAVQEVQDGVS